MINKDLELKYHDGTMTDDEEKLFFKNMSKKEHWGFSDKVFRLLAGKSYSSISMAKCAEDRVLSTWLKYHDIWAESYN